MSIKVPLIELLADRELCHPSRIATFSLQDGAASIKVVGPPWWDPKLPSESECELHLTFPGLSDVTIGEGFFDGDPFEEDLEGLEVQCLADTAWHAGRQAKVFVYAPMPDPLAFLVDFEETAANMGCHRDFSDYLASFDGLGSLRRRMATDMYLLGEFSSRILEWVRSELTRLGLRHSVVEADHAGRLAALRKRYGVTLIGCEMICAAPMANWNRP